MCEVDSKDRAATLDALPDGVVTYPFPEDGRDLLTLSDDELRDYGLPTLGDAGSDAVLAFRIAFLKARDGFRTNFVPFATAAPGMLRVMPLSAPTGSRPVQKSLNWSGGYVVPRSGQSFKSVMGHWTIPSVAAPGGSTQSEFHSSTWIGLDGQRFYRDSSLPQIGTKQIWSAGAAQPPYAWYQWWARDQPTSEFPLSLSVAPGHEISAILTVIAPAKVRFNLKNESTGAMLQAFEVAAPSPCQVSGATAEWVMERPSPPGSTAWDAYELPSYTAFSFTQCLAQAGSPGSNVLQPYDLQTATLIRMYEIEHTPPAVRTISTAHRVLKPPQELQLSYVGP